MKDNTCPKCQSTDLDKGGLVSAGPCTYRSDKQRTPFVAPNCRAVVCNACGYVELFVDEAYLAKMKSR